MFMLHATRKQLCTGCEMRSRADSRGERSFGMFMSKDIQIISTTQQINHNAATKGSYTAIGTQPISSKPSITTATPTPRLRRRDTSS